MVVLGCWVAFVVLFVVRRPAMGLGVAKRDPRSIVGIAIAGIGFAVAWGHPALYPDRQGVGVLLAAPVALGSIVLAAWAIRTLGAQWSLQAQLKTNHELVTTGPYRLVRHPIYTSLLGMLVATALVFSDNRRLAIAVVLYLIGTFIRIHSEESLLRQRFGAAFDTYAHSTPAVFPLFGKTPR
jgi:protein-S-isoprenylcysteine O-methyltransferase Ste14